MTNDGTHTYQDDAENRLIKIMSGAATIAQYGYGPQGERVSKMAGGVTTCFYWGIGEKVNGSWTRLYVQGLGGKLVESSDGGTKFFVTNHLGTIAARMDLSGQTMEIYRYLPYGERYAGNQTPHQYTGTERDAESGLDYFGARYLSSAHGRWMSVDPGLSSKAPQRLNRYAYVLGNPTTFVDPDGRTGICINFPAVGGGEIYWHTVCLDFPDPPPPPHAPYGSLPGSHNFYEGQQDVAKESGSERGRPPSIPGDSIPSELNQQQLDILFCIFEKGHSGQTEYERYGAISIGENGEWVGWITPPTYESRASTHRPYFPPGAIAVVHTHPREGTAFRPSGPDWFFIGENQRGLWRSTDGGTVRLSWGIILDQRGIIFMDQSGFWQAHPSAGNNWYQDDHYNDLDCDKLLKEYNPNRIRPQR